MPTTPPTVDVGSVSSGRTADLPTLPLVLNHTVVSGTEALLVYVAYDDFFAQIPVMDINGTDIPLMNSHQFSTAHRPFWYQLIPNPTAGAQVITITATGAVLGNSAAACAINIFNYGGIRFGEWTFEDGIAPYIEPFAEIYAADTDLIIAACATKGSGTVFTPDSGQTVLLDQSSLADSAIKIALSYRYGLGTTVLPALTTPGYTLNPDPLTFSFYALAIQGRDLTPVGVPGMLATVVNTQTLEQQPNPAGFPLAPPPGYYWRCFFTVPSTHRFLAVLIEVFDSSVTSVTFNGLPLTQHTAADRGSLWYLVGAPVGAFLLEVRLNARRWFCAGAYALNGITGSASDIIGVATRNSAGNSVSVPSQAGAIVIDLIKVHSVANLTFVPTSGATVLFANPVRLYSRGTSVNEGTESGASSYQIASGASTPMSWSGTVTSFTNQQIGFSFLGTTPPPPPPENPGCPNTLTVPAGGGVGCSTTLPTG